jgi:hypothetical protein
MEPMVDPSYDQMRRHLGRRAALVVGTALVITACVLFSMSSEVVSGLGGRARLAPLGLGLFGAPSSTVPTGGDTAACTAADLVKPRMTAMPAPEVVSAPLVVQPAPDLEQLSPPDSLPEVSASQAWSSVRRAGVVVPTTAGSAEVLLGDLYAATPAIIEPDNSAKPVYTHTLVWAIFGRHQPELSSGGPPLPRGSAATRMGPVCVFESTMFYVDALTGKSLVAEVFPPYSDPQVSF